MRWADTFTRVRHEFGDGGDQRIGLVWA